MLRNLISGIKKEILLIIRHRNAMLLVVLFPLITIWAFGSIYSYNLTQSLSIAVFVDPNTLAVNAEAPNNEFNYNVDFVKELEKNKNLNVKTVYSEDELNQEVLQKAVDSGLIIKRDNFKAPYNITIVVDNTDFIKRSVIWGTLSNQINGITTDISIAIIQKIYEKIVSQEARTKQQLQRISDFMAEFQKTKQLTSRLSEDANKLDVNELHSLLEEQKQELIRIREDINASDYYYNNMISNLQKFPNFLHQTISDTGLIMRDANGTMIYTSNGVAQMEAITNNYWTQQLNEAQTQQNKERLAGSAIDKSIAAIDSLEQKTEATNQYVQNFQSYVAEAVEAQKQIESDLKESHDMLVEINDTIQNIKQYSPEFLAKPTQIQFGEVIVLPNLATLFFPMVLALVSMFGGLLLTAVSIISEKKQNVSSRMKSMPLSKSALVLQKLFGIVIILFLVMTALTILGSIFFGIQISGNPTYILLGLALTILCFVSIGIAIGTVTNNESSAILAILVIVFPMIFLSGLLLPLELMPQGFQIFKIINPLATSSTLLVNTMIKGIPIIYSIKEIINLTVVSVIGLIVGYLKYL